MDIKLVDVVIHLHEEITHDARESLQDGLRGLDGVVAADSHDKRPHLMVVGYDPDRVNSGTILGHIQGKGVHAELVGL